MKIVRDERRTMIRDKRFRMPFTIHTTCPKCSRPHIRESGEHVAYPTPGKVMELDFWCGHEPTHVAVDDPRFRELACDHEWSVDVVMDITLRLATKDDPR